MLETYLTPILDICKNSFCNVHNNLNVCVTCMLGKFHITTTVGGYDVCPTQNYKHLVSLQSNGFHFCGGTLYGSRHVITAAHCWEGVSASELAGMKVVVNRHDLSTSLASEVRECVLALQLDGQ